MDVRRLSGGVAMMSVDVCRLIGAVTMISVDVRRLNGAVALMSVDVRRLIATFAVRGAVATTSDGFTMTGVVVMTEAFARIDGVVMIGIESFSPTFSPTSMTIGSTFFT